MELQVAYHIILIFNSNLLSSSASKTQVAALAGQLYRPTTKLTSQQVSNTDDQVNPAAVSGVYPHLPVGQQPVLLRLPALADTSTLQQQQQQ
jgi:hypothetical protein